MKSFLGGLLIFLQLVLIINARFGVLRYYCWAPHDEQSVFNLSVIIDQKQLTREETNKRYRFTDWRYWQDGKYRNVRLESRSIENIKSIISQFESTYGQDDQASVTLTYEINGGPAKTWQWPADQ